jgi:hypothetical protein
MELNRCMAAYSQNSSDGKRFHNRVTGVDRTTGVWFEPLSVTGVVLRIVTGVDRMTGVL